MDTKIKIICCPEFVWAQLGSSQFFEKDIPILIMNFDSTVYKRQMFLEVIFY